MYILGCNYLSYNVNIHVRLHKRKQFVTEQNVNVIFQTNIYILESCIREVKIVKFATYLMHYLIKSFKFTVYPQKVRLVVHLRNQNQTVHVKETLSNRHIELNRTRGNLKGK